MESFGAAVDGCFICVIGVFDWEIPLNRDALALARDLAWACTADPSMLLPTSFGRRIVGGNVERVIDD